MKYTEINGVKIISCEPNEFSIALVNKTKKNITSASTYVNANFFAPNQKYQGQSPSFTLPINHLICDYENTVANCRKMDELRGTFIGNKYYYDSYNYGAPGDQFYKKALTTFYIKNGIPKIIDMTTLDRSCTYAIAGIPIMKNGNDVKWLTYVKPQGWTGGELYSTYHIFIGLKAGSNTIYIMNWCSTTSNMIYSGAAYKKFKALGFTDVIKLDGGGSTIMKYNGTVKQQTSENRQINAIIKVTNKTSTNNNTTTNETSTSITTTSNVKKNVQVFLNTTYKSGLVVDGSLGTATLKAIIKGMQTECHVVADGSWGPGSQKAYTVIKYGGSNNTTNKIKLVQCALCRKGYWTSDINGVFDITLKNQIMAYQKAAKLAVDGMVGPATIKSLFT